MKQDDSTKARYLERAAELREAAAGTKNEAERAVLIKGAEAYEHMARWTPKVPISGNKK